MVSSTPRPLFTPGKDPVPILQEAGWASGPVWTGGKSRPHRDLIPDRPFATPTELPGPLSYKYRSVIADVNDLLQSTAEDTTFCKISEIILFIYTVKPVLNGLSRDQKIFPLKAVSA